MNDSIIKAAVIIAAGLIVAAIILMYPTYKCIATYDAESISLCLGGK